MAEPFDPYYTWLAISKSDQPPHHYRLLGVDLFEANPDVISHAADQRMAHLRTFQAGKHGPLSQKLLNEVAAARVCLLNPQKKAAYDQSVRDRLPAPRTAAEESESSGDVRLRAELAEIVETGHRSPATTARPRTSIWPWAVAAALVAAGVLGALWIANRPPREIAARPQGRPNEVKPGPDFPVPPRGNTPAAQPAPPSRSAVDSASKPKTTPLPSPTAAPKLDNPRQTGPVAGGPAPGRKPESADARSASPVPLAAAPANQTPPEAKSKQAPRTPNQPAQAAPVGRQPVPGEESLSEAVKAAQEVFGREYEKARTAADRQALARKVLEHGLKTQQGTSQRFVLLRLTRDIAMKAEDCKLALRAVSALAATFEVDSLSMKAEILAGLAKAAKTTPAHKTVAENAIAAAEEAQAADRLAAAEEAARLAVVESGKARDKELGIRARGLAKEVQDATKAAATVDIARQKLRATPDDPPANAAVGRYLCFVRGDWERGSPHFLKGDDLELKALAEMELEAEKTTAAAEAPPGPASSETEKSAGTAAERARKLADGWWEQAQKKEGKQRDQLFLHAGYWYRQTPIGDDLRLRGRLEQIEKTRRQIPSPPPAVAPFDGQQAKDHQRRWAKYLGLPVTMINSIGMRFVLIPPGEFVMGLSKEEHDELDGVARANKEHEWFLVHLSRGVPQHPVRITQAFYMGIYEVTQDDYRRVTGNNPSQFSSTGRPAPALSGKDRGRNPVEMISWDEARTFCDKLSFLSPEQAVRRAYRLPSEAQWEYACRAGTSTRWFSGNEPADLDAIGWHRGNAARSTHPVGQKRPNAFGLFDMHGNVWEWCHDWDGRDYYRQSPVADPPGGAQGSMRIVRGGSWNHPFYYSGSGYRGSDPPRVQTGVYGFRVVCKCP